MLSRKRHSKPLLTHLQEGPFIEGDDKKGYRLSNWARHHLATTSPEAQVILVAYRTYGGRSFYPEDINRQCAEQFELLPNYVSRLLRTLVRKGYLERIRKGQYKVVTGRVSVEEIFLDALSKRGLY